jgi:predicted Zn-dependent protease
MELGEIEQSKLARARAADREREIERLERARMRVVGDPSVHASRRALGALYLEQGDAPRAIVELKRVLAERPGDATARRLLGQALKAAGRVE